MSATPEYIGKLKMGFCLFLFVLISSYLFSRPGLSVLGKVSFSWPFPHLNRAHMLTIGKLNFCSKRMPRNYSLVQFQR